jgi:hypothetical protein
VNLDAGAIYFGVLTLILTPILCLIARKSGWK